MTGDSNSNKTTTDHSASPASAAAASDAKPGATPPSPDSLLNIDPLNTLSNEAAALVRETQDWMEALQGLVSPSSGGIHAPSLFSTKAALSPDEIKSATQSLTGESIDSISGIASQAAAIIASAAPVTPPGSSTVDEGSPSAAEPDPQTATDTPAPQQPTPSVAETDHHSPTGPHTGQTGGAQVNTQVTLPNGLSSSCPLGISSGGAENAHVTQVRLPDDAHLVIRSAGAVSEDDSFYDVSGSTEIPAETGKTTTELSLKQDNGQGILASVIALTGSQSGQLAYQESTLTRSDDGPELSGKLLVSVSGDDSQPRAPAAYSLELRVRQNTTEDNQVALKSAYGCNLLSEDAVGQTIARIGPETAPPIIMECFLTPGTEETAGDFAAVIAVASYQLATHTKLTLTGAPGLEEAVSITCHAAQGKNPTVIPHTVTLQGKEGETYQLRLVVTELSDQKLDVSDPAALRALLDRTEGLTPVPPKKSET